MGACIQSLRGRIGAYARVRASRVCEGEQCSGGAHSGAGGGAGGGPHGGAGGGAGGGPHGGAGGGADTGQAVAHTAGQAVATAATETPVVPSRPRRAGAWVEVPGVGVGHVDA